MERKAEPTDLERTGGVWLTFSLVSVLGALLIAALTNAFGAPPLICWSVGIASGVGAGVVAASIPAARRLLSSLIHLLS